MGNRLQILPTMRRRTRPTGQAHNRADAQEQLCAGDRHRTAQGYQQQVPTVNVLTGVNKMQATEMEMAGVFFAPHNGHVEWAIADLAQMQVGTMMNGILIIRKDDEPNEYMEGTIEVQAHGIEFTEGE